MLIRGFQVLYSKQASSVGVNLGENDDLRWTCLGRRPQTQPALAPEGSLEMVMRHRDEVAFS